MVPTFWLLWVILIWMIVHKSLCEICVFTSLGQIHRNRIVGLYGKFAFDFLKHCQMFFKVIVLFYPVDIQAEERFPFLQKLRNKLVSGTRNQFHFERIYKSSYSFWVCKMVQWTTISKRTLKYKYLAKWSYQTCYVYFFLSTKSR